MAPVLFNNKRRATAILFSFAVRTSVADWWKMPTAASSLCLQVTDLQNALKEEQIIVEEKKAQTDELIVSIGKEKAVVDEAVEAGREDEEAASKLAEEVLAFQEECSKDLAVGTWRLSGPRDVHQTWIQSEHDPQQPQ